MAGAVVEQWQPKVEERAEVRLNGIIHESGVSEVETRESFRYVGELVEEFESVTTKITTHMNCPKCLSEIAEVVVRRKVLSYQPNLPPVDLLEPGPDLGHLLGCFSCLSLFTCSDNGCLNPFEFSTKGSEAYINLASPSSDEQKEVLIGNESCFTMFWVFEKEKHNLKPQPIIISDQVQSLATPTAEGISYDDTMINNENKPGLCRLPSFDHVCRSDASEHFDNDIEEERGISRAPSFDLVGHTCCIDVSVYNAGAIRISQSRGRSRFGYKSVLVEILKSIIYGGLREVIASSSVVAFASAFFANTPSIIALAVASLIGGIFVMGHNLWDLREDNYNDYEEPINYKYEELLGQVNNFPLHAIFAILSFLMFGMVTPVAYTLSFHKTNDKDSTLVVVAIVSLLCVLLLAMFKAYINRYTIFKSIKIVVYYATMVVILSSVSYGAGNLLTRLMEKIGLFDTSSNGGMSLLPHATTSTLASF